MKQAIAGSEADHILSLHFFGAKTNFVTPRRAESFGIFRRCTRTVCGPDQAFDVRVHGGEYANRGCRKNVDPGRWPDHGGDVNDGMRLAAREGHPGYNQ